MKVSQSVYSEAAWQPPLETLENAQLVIIFGDRNKVAEPSVQEALRINYPKAEFIGCTTSGEILDAQLHDDSLCLSAVEFSNSTIEIHKASVNDQPVSLIGKQLAEQLSHDKLRYVLVLSDGQKVNGTELIKGMTDVLPEDVLITGGLAGDGTRFEETVIWHNNEVAAEQILVCGFYGDSFQVAHGCMGGWDPFGPARRVTHSSGNILYSLDDKPALELYKKYLGKHAQELPSSALLFPLLVKRENQERAITRTILNINEDDGSMIFAGDIPEGSTVQLMQANFNRLIDGAEMAAENTLSMLSSQPSAGLVLMISCVGRRLVLKQRSEEELEAVSDLFGPHWCNTGFYSYGEISPALKDADCDLHNQTMTITALFEKNA